MANLLVHVAPEHLDGLLGTGMRETGRRVPVARATLPPQIERLDATSTLFFVTVERVRARIVASLEQPRSDGPKLGDATIHDLDITDLLARLGCKKVWHVPQWAATPRIVPPNDAQLLRYHLGLPLEPDETGEIPNMPIPVVRDAPLDWKSPPRLDPETDARLAELEAKLAEIESRWAVRKFERAATPPAEAEAITKPFAREPDAVATEPFRRQPASPPAEPVAASSLRHGEPPRGHPVSPMTAPTSPALARAPRRTGSHSAVHATPGAELRDAVYASPASDAPRRAYAAFLQELGDERGELIALQLGRVERGETISDRERELTERVGDGCAEPLRPYFASYELRRGFVWKARMERGVTVPEDMREHPAWATIDDLATTDAALLGVAPLKSLRRARIDQGTFEALGTSDGLVHLETLLPYPVPGEPARGIVLEPIEPVRWLDVIDGGAFVTHSLCVDAVRLAGRLKQFLQSRLVRRLSHLDAWIDASSARAWRESFDVIDLPLLTLRFAAHGIEPVIAFERRDGAPRMVVELRATVSAEIAHALAALIVNLGKGMSELELVDTSLAPFPAQQPELVRTLGSAFTTIDLHRGQTLALV